jgi:hypothetical protein
VTTTANIRKIVYSTWAVTRLIGGTGTSFADGVGTNAGFNNIFGIAVTSDNNIAFVVDQLNQRIRRIDISTATVTTLAGSGAAGGTNGVGTNAKFNRPFGLALYPVDNSFMLITNDFGYTVVKIEVSTANVTSFAGVYLSASNTDGTGSGAKFSGPVGISFHPSGSYAVLIQFGTSYNRIRKITYPGAVVTTLAGSGASGSTDGTGTEATFNSPRGISIDVYGSYAVVADFGAYTLRKVMLSTAAVTTFAGVAGIPGSVDGAANTAKFNGGHDVCFAQYDNAAVIMDFSNHKLRLIQGFEPTPSPSGFTELILSHNKIL